MSTEPSLWSFIAQAGIVVQCVMLLLLATSIASWTFIIQKFHFLKQQRKAGEQFEKRFWEATKNDHHVLETFKNLRKHHSSLVRIFQAGLTEFHELNHPNVKNESLIKGVERAMQVAGAREMESLNQHLPFLATVGSTSPYIGLFGTVWGIMSAFTALGSVHSATIAMVAPGISEALIATAMGLFTAIPAVIAYNCYTHEVERLVDRFETFQEAFIHFLYRKVHTDGAL